MSNKRRFKENLSTRLPWFTELYKKKLPCIFQVTNKVMFLSWSLIKQQECICICCIEIRTNVLARHGCGYDIICETAK